MKECQESESGVSGAATEATELTAAQRARTERNRLRARALQEARLVRHTSAGEVVKSANGGKAALDSGGGFLLEEEPAPRPAAAPAPAPHVHRAAQPRCLACGEPFPQSYLLDTFDHSVCDACRDDDGEHQLITRTEAKSEFLLKDCDLDSRPPPLRCVRRRNPHRASYGEMRLYLRAQVEARALEVWGSERRLEEELAARSERRARARTTHERRRLRALRMDVRGSLFDRTHAAHEHAFGEERHDAAADRYERTCASCGYTEVYEKM